jgi:hypothetical protein
MATTPACKTWGRPGTWGVVVQPTVRAEPSATQAGGATQPVHSTGTSAHTLKAMQQSGSRQAGEEHQTAKPHSRHRAPRGKRWMPCGGLALIPPTARHGTCRRRNDCMCDQCATQKSWRAQGESPAPTPAAIRPRYATSHAAVAAAAVLSWGQAGAHSTPPPLRCTLIYICTNLHTTCAPHAHAPCPQAHTYMSCSTLAGTLHPEARVSMLDCDTNQPVRGEPSLWTCAERISSQVLTLC